MNTAYQDVTRLDIGSSQENLASGHVRADPVLAGGRLRPPDPSGDQVGPPPMRSPEPVPMAAPAVGHAIGQPPRAYVEPLNRASVRRSGPSAAKVGDGVYRTRRPGVAVLLAAVTAALEAPALRLLLHGSFGASVGPGLVVAGAFLVIGLPAFAFGAYALVTGVGRSPDQPPGHAWLRPPGAFLTVGLVLFVAAALAA